MMIAINGQFILMLMFKSSAFAEYHFNKKSKELPNIQLIESWKKNTGICAISITHRLSRTRRVD